jgi:hypothetical protein
LVFDFIQCHVEKNHQVVWDSLLDYGGYEWQCTLEDLEKSPDIAYNDVLVHLTRIGVSNASLLLVAI